MTLYPKSPENFNAIREVGNFTCSIRPLFVKQFILLECWFICSFITIVLNRYILTSLDHPGVYWRIGISGYHSHFASYRHSFALFSYSGKILQPCVAATIRMHSVAVLSSTRAV